MSIAIASDELLSTQELNERKSTNSIGVAKILNDGTLVLQLRAETAGGTTGEALLSYPPSHPEYEAILKHVGPLRPGESTAVPPWPGDPD